MEMVKIFRQEGAWKKTERTGARPGFKGTGVQKLWTRRDASRISVRNLAFEG